MRNVTKVTDAAGRLTDEGREARPSEADGPVSVLHVADERGAYDASCAMRR